MRHVHAGPWLMQANVCAVPIREQRCRCYAIDTEPRLERPLYSIRHVGHFGGQFTRCVCPSLTSYKLWACDAYINVCETRMYRQMCLVRVAQGRVGSHRTHPRFVNQRICYCQARPEYVSGRLHVHPPSRNHTNSGWHFLLQMPSSTEHSTQRSVIDSVDRRASASHVSQPYDTSPSLLERDYEPGYRHEESSRYNYGPPLVKPFQAWCAHG